MPIFDHAHPTTITLSFLEFVSANKKSVYSINSFLSYSQFKSPMTRMATHIFPHNHPNIFQSTFNFHESVSICKKAGYFIILFYEYIWFAILQSDWPRTLWPISQEPDFPDLWDLCRKIKNNINFHYRPNSEKKLMATVFNKFKKPYFWAIFGQFLQFSFFLFLFGKIWLSHTTSYGF